MPDSIESWMHSIEPQLMCITIDVHDVHQASIWLNAVHHGINIAQCCASDINVAVHHASIWLNAIYENCVLPACRFATFAGNINIRVGRGRSRKHYVGVKPIPSSKLSSYNC